MKTLNTLVALALLVSVVAPACAMEDAPAEIKPSFFANAKETFFAKATALKDFYAFNPENKAESFKRYGITAAAVAAVIGLGYAAYDFLTSEDEEEVVAPVDEPQVSTVEPAVEAPVVVNRPAVSRPVVAKPAVKKPARRMSKCQARAARIARAKSGKTSSCSKSRKFSCKPCQA